MLLCIYKGLLTIHVYTYTRMIVNAFQNNTNTNFQKIKIHYHELLAFSLIEYAKIDDVFAGHLKYLVDSFSPSEITHFSLPYHNVSLIMPRDRQSAVERADWLMNEISNFNASRASLLLGAWNRSAVTIEPKQIVVGIIGVAIPGPTPGLIKRRVSMMIIVKEDVAIDELAFTERVIEASHTLSLSEFRNVNGNMYRLEPDFSEWFFGEKELSFYRATPKQLLDLKSELQLLSLRYEHDTEKKVFSVSPLANESFTSLKYELEPILT